MWIQAALTLNRIADLVKGDVLLFADQRHRVLQVKVRLAVVVKATAININGACSRIAFSN